jgi:glycerophosphoryl diester phosphodiesterase
MHFSLTHLAAGVAVALLMTAANETQAAGPPLVVAHRGFSYVAPENTLVAMREGWKSGAYGVELDVHMTGDGQVIVIHDDTTSRTTGVDLPVSATKTADLQKLDAGTWKNPKYKGEKLPLLKDVLAEMPEDGHIFIEIKSGPETVQPVKKIVESGPWEKRVTIIGFGLTTMADAKKAMPERQVYWLRGADKDKKTGEYIPRGKDIIEPAVANGLDGLDVSWAGITPEFIKEAKAAGLSVHAWTVDYDKEVNRLIEAGVDSITTNRPDVVLELVNKATAAE